MTVAVVSGTGFLGRAVMRRLEASDVPAVAIARGVTSPPGVRFECADRMDTDALSRIFRAHDVSAVIDIYPLSLNNSRPVIEATARRGARYVMISSVDVYSNYEGLLRKGLPNVRAEPATERSPLRVMRYPYRGNQKRPQGVEAALLDDYDKLPIEEALRDEYDLPYAIIRPPMIFGPGDPQARFSWAVRAAEGSRPIQFDARAASWLNSYAYIDDAANAIALLATHPGAEGRAWNVAYQYSHSQRWWLELVLRVTGSAAGVKEVPPEALGLLHERANAMDLRYPLTLDSSLIRQELGYLEVMSEEEALETTLANGA